MVKQLSLLLALLSGFAPSVNAPIGEKPMVKPPRAEINYAIVDESDTLELDKKDKEIVSSDDGIMVLPETENNAVEKADPDEAYEAKKDALKTKYARMFEIKAELDENREERKTLLDEYKALRHSYERELIRIVGDWAQAKAEI